MKTSAQIQFDFDQARRRATDIEEIAADLSQLSRRDMENVMAELAGVWKGESARLFQAKADTLQGEMKKTADDLRGIAATIREIARRMYEAEMEALRIASQRDSGGGGGRSGGTF